MPQTAYWVLPSITRPVIKHAMGRIADLSIVVPVYNCEAYLVEMFERLFLDSLRRYAPEGAELIIVDDASPLEQETRRLAKAAETFMKVTLLRNPSNAGMVRSINTGLREAIAPTVLLLNSDTRLTDGAVESLQKVLTSNADIGMVGPVSNNAFNAELQQVEGLAPLQDFSDNELKRIDRYSRDIRDSSGQGPVEAAYLMGFCLLFRRDILNRVGLFDERLGLGYYEDIDYSRRVRDEGYRLLIDRSTFIFHGGLKKSNLAGRFAGSQTMRTRPLRAMYTLIRNAIYLQFKHRGWGSTSQKIPSKKI
jgi:GT2 family glycosyltransferase